MRVVKHRHPADCVAIDKQLVRVLRGQKSAKAVESFGNSDMINYPCCAVIKGVNDEFHGRNIRKKIVAQLKFRETVLSPVAAWSCSFVSDVLQEFNVELLVASEVDFSGSISQELVHDDDGVVAESIADT